MFNEVQTFDWQWIACNDTVTVLQHTNTVKLHSNARNKFQKIIIMLLKATSECDCKAKVCLCLFKPTYALTRTCVHTYIQMHVKTLGHGKR